MRFLTGLTDSKEDRKNAMLNTGEPTGSMEHDPDLVHKLKEEHQELLRIVAAIKKTVTDNQLQQLPNLLYSFKTTFEKHLALENTKLYVYLRQNSAPDEITARFVSTVHAEMDDVAYALNRFVDMHLSAPPDSDTVTLFSSELARLSSLLTWRLQFEERSLFYFYQHK